MAVVGDQLTWYIRVLTLPTSAPVVGQKAARPIRRFLDIA